MTLTGGCHCRNITYELHWPAGNEKIPARRCGCDYCKRFNGAWTSHPGAALAISCTSISKPGCYRFGTETADFLFCGTCGVAVAAVCEIAGARRAVLNVNTLDPGDYELEHSDSEFEGETVETRLGRRAADWIGEVTLHNCIAE